MTAGNVNALGITSHLCSDSLFLGAVYTSGRGSWQVWRPAPSFLVVLVSPSTAAPIPAPARVILSEIPTASPGPPHLQPLLSATGTKQARFLVVPLPVRGWASFFPNTSEEGNWRGAFSGRVGISLCANTAFVRRCFPSYNSRRVCIWAWSVALVCLLPCKASSCERAPTVARELEDGA